MNYKLRKTILHTLYHKIYLFKAEILITDDEIFV